MNKPPSKTAQAATFAANGLAHVGHDRQGGGSAGPPPRPGNYFARRLAANYQILLDSVTADHLRAITRKLLEMAEQGNLAAAKLLLQYIRH